jgi:tellurite resistance protein TehA-like permease
MTRVPDTVGLFFVVVLGFGGAALLHESVSATDAVQTAHIIAGAALISLGLVTLVLIAKNWLHWRKHYKLAESAEMDVSGERR